MKNYLKIEFNGGVVDVKWFKNKSFEEIVNISKKEFENESKKVLDECIKNSLNSEVSSKEMYFGDFNIKNNEGVVYSNERVEFIGLYNERIRSVGYYNEDLVSEFIDVDLEDEKNKELLSKVEKDLIYRILN